MIARARLSIKSIECSETSISIKHQQSNLARQLMAAIQDFQKIHFRAKQMYRDNIKRQYKIAQPFATEAEIERIMEDHQAAAAGNNNNNITSLMSSGFQQDFNTNPNLEEQRKALQGVESRLHELESIEKAICQLFDIMQDMQLMLGNQQAAFDSIEIMVDTTADQVHDGSNQLTKATVSAKGARKKKWILLIIVILLLIIAIILVYFYVILPMTTAKKITEKAAN